MSEEKKIPPWLERAFVGKGDNLCMSDELCGLLKGERWGAPLSEHLAWRDRIAHVLDLVPREMLFKSREDLLKERTERIVQRLQAILDDEAKQLGVPRDHRQGAQVSDQERRDSPRPVLYRGSEQCDECRGELHEGRACKCCGAEIYDGPARLISRPMWVVDTTKNER